MAKVKKSQIIATKMKKRQAAQRKFASKGVFIIVLIFFACAFFSVYQHFVISKLDQQVMSLQEEYDNLKAINESKVGAITGQWGYDELEALATSYGMIYPGESQRVTESVTQQKIDESGLENSRWYNRLLH